MPPPSAAFHPFEQHRPLGCPGKLGKPPVLIDVPDRVQRLDVVHQQVVLGVGAGFNAVFPHLICPGEWLDTLECRRSVSPYRLLRRGCWKNFSNAALFSQIGKKVARSSASLIVPAC
jgi:hypothetical protein